jgi:hypothetical protein
MSLTENPFDETVDDLEYEMKKGNIIKEYNRLKAEADARKKPTMAGMLSMHQDYVNDDDSDGILCAGCFARIQPDGDSHAGFLSGLADHQALELSRAGFGSVRAGAEMGWDAAVGQMTYTDGTPVEIAENINPFRTAG